MACMAGLWPTNASRPEPGAPRLTGWDMRRLLSAALPTSVSISRISNGLRKRSPPTSERHWDRIISDRKDETLKGGNAENRSERTDYLLKSGYLGGVTSFASQLADLPNLNQVTVPDLWQQQAVRALREGKDVVVQA